jgi:hypothetical protein
MSLGHLSVHCSCCSLRPRRWLTRGPRCAAGWAVCNGYVKSGGVRLSMRAARPGSAPGEWVTLAYGCRGRTVISFCLSCWRRSRSKAKPSQFVRIGRLKEPLAKQGARVGGRREEKKLEYRDGPPAGAWSSSFLGLGGEGKRGGIAHFQQLQRSRREK